MLRLAVPSVEMRCGSGLVYLMERFDCEVEDKSLHKPARLATPSVRCLHIIDSRWATTTVI